MKHDEFAVGKEFKCGGNPYRVTDIGKRVIVAIPLEHPEDTSWYNGPPYAIVECVFDEEDIKGCTAKPRVRKQ